MRILFRTTPFLIPAILVLAGSAHCAWAQAASGDGPRLVRFSGSVTDAGGRAASGETALTFIFYESQQGGAPLWSETQTVRLNSQGRYSIMLGATQTSGLPQNLFTGNQARWIGVQPALPGVAEQPRVMLAGVPYALKASDAESLGGRPAAAYVTTDALNALLPLAAAANPAAGEQTDPHPDAVTPATTGSGKKNYIPVWTGSTTQSDSAMFQSGTGSTAAIGIGTTTPAATLDVHGGVSVRGTLSLPATGAATPAIGNDSEALAFTASVFNSTAQAAQSQRFTWQAEPAQNNSSTPSATLNLLYGANGGSNLETGLSIGSTGLISFAPGQVFPGAGTGTLTGVTAGTGLKGGGTSGNISLGIDTSVVPQLNAANTFTGNQTMNGNLTASGNATVSGAVTAASLTAGPGVFSQSVSAPAFSLPATTSTSVGMLYLGGQPFLHSYGDPSNIYLGQGSNSSFGVSTDNTAVGYKSLASNYDSYANTAVGTYAGFSQTTSGFNTDIGYSAGSYITTGLDNTSVGGLAAVQVTTGAGNTTVGFSAGENNITGNYNTYLGYAASSSALSNSLTNATAIGANAAVSRSSSLVLGGTGDSAVNVGIGTTAPVAPMTIAADSTGTRGVPIQLEIQGVTNPNQQLLIGYATSPGTSGYGTIQSTNDGVVNTPLLLNPLGGGVTVGTSAPVSNSLTVGQGQGAAVADGWATYSSRRWKTNIRTLPDALGKVERLRGVSYDLKTTGKHEIGVIAEEVGAVVPEVVRWEKNGKDAQSVDYSRLTALLIEAVKQQQAQLERATAQIRQDHARLAAQSTMIRRLSRELRVLATPRALLAASRH